MRRSHTTAISAALAVLLLAAGATGAAAQTPDNGIDPFADGGLADRAAASAAGIADRGIEWVRYQLGARAGGVLPGVEEPPTAEERANDLQQYVNDRNETLTAYANDQILGDQNLTEPRVAEVTVTGPEGETATRHVVVRVSDGQVSEVEAVNNTGLSANVTIGLSGYATSEARTEAERLFSEYVQADKRPTEAERTRVVSKYGGSVTIDGERLPGEGDEG